MNIEININVLNCPVCGATFRGASQARDENSRANVKQHVEFHCSASWERSARTHHDNFNEPYGKWDAWVSVIPCSKAQEIALKLIAQQPKVVAP